MDDVWGDFLGPPHGTTPAAVIANKNKQIQRIYVPRLNFLVTQIYLIIMYIQIIVSNIYLRIIFKPHANLQIMVRTSVQFEKNRNKTVGGVVHTRYPMSIHFHCINA